MERLSRGARKHNRIEKGKARKEGRSPNVLFASKTPKELRVARKDLRIIEKMRKKQLERRERRWLARDGIIFHRGDRITVYKL